ncbi:MAG: GWxTD domain-containing protein [Bacteroidales bacterium]
MKKPFFYILLFCFIISGVSAKKLSKINLSQRYAEDSFTKVQNLVYHSAEDSSTIFLLINLHHLKYVYSGSTSRQARFSVSYELYDSWDAKQPADTSSIIFTDNQLFDGEMEMVVEFDVKTPFPGNYILKYELVDLFYPDNRFIDIIEIGKTESSLRQNFFVTDDNGFPVFGNFLPSGYKFRVYYNNPTANQLLVRYFDKKFPLAKPPFAVEKDQTYKFEPDSMYTVALNNGSSDLITLPFHGIYHFQTDISKPDGLTLFRFDDGFPEVNSPALAIAPLRYLSTEYEFNTLLSYEDYKTAVDSFWLERASQQPQRAKNMIKRYYSRVQEANIMFSSYQEGWKTDRGLLYIIYGPPSEVYRNEDEEEWIYGERGNPLSMRFFFYKVENPFTSNDFQLNRSTNYKTSWYIAIENWRR